MEIIDTDKKIRRPCCAVCAACGKKFIKSGHEIIRSYKRGRGLVDTCSPKCQRIYVLPFVHAGNVQRSTNNVRNMWDKFWEKVDKTPGLGLSKEYPDCWEWRGLLDTNGYGVFQSKGKNYSTHKILYLLYKGEFLNSFYLCHNCDNPPCCKPDHLFLGTQADNMNDMVSKDRQPKGENKSLAKLTDKNVILIKKMLGDGISQTHIAKLFQVHQSRVSKIACGKAWRHI